MNMNTITTLAFLAVLFSALACLAWAGWKLHHQRWWKCSWCGWWFSDMGIVRWDNPGIATDEITYGFCPDCAAREKAKLTCPTKDKSQWKKERWSFMHIKK